MELELLKTLIERRNKKLDEEYKRNPAYDYLIDTRENLDNPEKILVSYLNISSNLSLEECQNIISCFNINSLKLTDSDLSRILDILVYLKLTDGLSSAKEYLLEKNPLKILSSWKRIKIDDGNTKTMIIDLKNLAKRYKVNLEGLIYLIENDLETFLDLSSIALDLKLKSSVLNIAKAKRLSYDRITSLSDRLGIFSKRIKSSRINLDEAKLKIKKYLEQLEAEEKNYYKVNKAEKYHNESILSMLEKELQKEEIVNVKPLIKKITDPQIKEVILLIIYKHNLKYANKLKTEYDKLMANSTTRYISLLHEHGITIQEEDLGDINHNSIEELEEILNILKNLSVPENLYLTILNITNLETIKTLKELNSKGYISKIVVINNLGLFNEDNILLNIIKTNIEIFNNYQINPTMFNELENILLMDSELLNNNLKVLEEYNLTKAFKNSTTYNFLNNTNLSVLIDKYLELGYEELLEKDLDILNYQDTRRVEILSNMGIILEKEELIEMFEYNKFFIPDEALDEYIPDAITVTGSLDITIEELLEYRKTSRTLEINGHLISINKVLKLLENNIGIKQAIFMNMNLDIDNYHEIESTLIGTTYHKEI